nr:MAG TPA: hypothetical protein [Caudoviricetes sp.]
MKSSEISGNTLVFPLTPGATSQLRKQVLFLFLPVFAQLTSLLHPVRVAQLLIC